MEEGLERLHRGGSFDVNFEKWNGPRVERRKEGTSTGLDVDKHQEWHWTSFSNRESHTHGDFDSGVNRGGMVDKPGLSSQGARAGILNLAPNGCVTLSKPISLLTCKVGAQWSSTSKGRIWATEERPKNVTSAL